MPAPDKSISVTSLVASLDDTQHGVTQAVVLTAATHTFSCFVRAGNKNFLYLSDDTVANCYSYFSLSAGTVGTTGAGCTAYIENWGGGLYRCCIVFLGTAAVHTLKIQSAEADADNTFAGDGSTVNSYIWASQCEANDYMSSPITTTTAQVTRSADTLRYEGLANLGGVGSNLMGTVSCQILLPNYNKLTDKYVLSLSDGGAGGDSIRLFGRAATEYARLQITSTGGNAGEVNGATTDVSNNIIHSLRATWKTNELKLFVDGAAEGSTDTLVDIPNDIDQIQVGAYVDGTLQGNALLNNLKIWKIITGKG